MNHYLIVCKTGTLVYQTKNSQRRSAEVHLEHSLIVALVEENQIVTGHINIEVFKSLSIIINATQHKILSPQSTASVPPIRSIPIPRRCRTRIQLNWHNSNTILRRRTPQWFPIIASHLRHAWPPCPRSRSHGSSLLPSPIHPMIINLIRVDLRTHIPILPLQLLHILDLVRGRFVWIDLIASNGPVGRWW